jgi:hypothetical protein
MKREECYALAEAAETLGASQVPASRKRLALRVGLFLILVLVGGVSLLVGLS